MNARSKVVAAVIAATTVSLAACSQPTRPVAVRTPAPSVVAIPGLGSVTLPAGFRVLGTWRLQAGRTNFLTAVGGDLYWLTDGRHARPDDKAPLRRVERLDPSTGQVSVVADSGTGDFGGIAAAGTGSLVVVREAPAPAAVCGAAAHGQDCVRPIFEAVSTSGGTSPRALATSDPQTAARESYGGGYVLDQAFDSVVMETVHRGHRSLVSWTSTDAAPRTVVTDAPSSVVVSAVGEALVGQYYGEHRMWTTGGPPLPAGAARGGIDPVGSATHLAWFNEHGAVEIAARRGQSYTAPTTVTTGQIYGLNWATDCLLYISESTGLFVAHICQSGPPRVENLLTADQSERIYLPAGFAFAPGRFAFAVKEPNAELLVLLQTPTA